MKKIKTLLVDDDYLVLQDLENLIDWGSLGFQLIGRATSGKKALEIACCQEPELIITDISMPAMDGFDFVETFNVLLSFLMQASLMPSVLWKPGYGITS